MKKNLIALSLAAALAAVSMAATAATPDAFYIGARGGYAHTDWDNGAKYLNDDDNAGYGLGLYAGYNFNEYFSLEGGYNYFDGFSAKAIDGSVGDYKIHGPEIAAKVNFPLTSSLDLYLRGGLMYAIGDGDGDIGGNKIAPLVGAGAQFACTDNFSLRLGYDRYFGVWEDDANKLDSGVDMDLDFAYVGFQYTFGQPAPAPAPEPVTKTITTSYSLDANTLFAFESDTLSPEGSQAVDQVLSDVQTTKIDGAKYNVVGHTDRLGAEAYNQKLSERRAQAVADDLMAKGVPATDIIVEGRGESQPVTGNKCDGLKKNDMINCLAPDRRVEINVVGTTTTTETVPAESL